MRPKATVESGAAAAASGGPAIAIGLLAGQLAISWGADPSLALSVTSAVTVVVGYAIRRFGLPDV